MREFVIGLLVEIWFTLLVVGRGWELGTVQGPVSRLSCLLSSYILFGRLIVSRHGMCYCEGSSVRH